MKKREKELRITRRAAIGGAVGALLTTGMVGLNGCDRRGRETMDENSDSVVQPDRDLMPVGFVAHGAPTLALNREKGADLTGWGRSMARPAAILVVSAHWEKMPVTIGTTRQRELMYDFSGFQKELYEFEYAAPGAPELADRVEGLLGAEAVTREDRPLDHGAWVPLVHMMPDADVPVLQISMPSRAGAERLFELGRLLSPLRDEGVLILGSGNLVHNLRRLDWQERRSPESWAVEFDQWTAETLVTGDVDGLIDFRNTSPGLAIAHPTVEHFEPLLVAAGAADGAPVSFPVEGWEYGNLSRRSVQFG